MSINTNGFITEYIKTVQNKEWLVKEEARLNNVINYYYFRSIIDGVYNLLKEYGWKYWEETFGFLKQQFNIEWYLSEGFDVFYCDYINCLNSTCVLDVVGTHIQHYIRYIPPTYDDDFISTPTDLDIMTVLNATEDFLKDSVKLYEQKESDEEYKTYLRLKEKYEGKNK